MDGRRAGQNGANGKWCNFAFDTEGAPKKLLALSEKAGIPKERAVLSFVFARVPGLEKVAATDAACKPKTGAARESVASPKSGGLLRVASDIIRVPAAIPDQKPRIGHYACSERGLVLALSSGGQRVYSGDLLEVESAVKPKAAARPGRERDSRPRRDAKTGALIVEI